MFAWVRAVWINNDCQTIVSEPQFSPSELKTATSHLERLVASFSTLAMKLGRIVIAEEKAGVPPERQSLAVVPDDYVGHPRRPSTALMWLRPSMQACGNTASSRVCVLACLVVLAPVRGDSVCTARSAWPRTS